MQMSKLQEATCRKRLIDHLREQEFGIVRKIGSGFLDPPFKTGVQNNKTAGYTIIDHYILYYDYLSIYIKSVLDLDKALRKGKIIDESFVPQAPCDTYFLLYSDDIHLLGDELMDEWFERYFRKAEQDRKDEIPLFPALIQEEMATLRSKISHLEVERFSLKEFGDYLRHRITGKPYYPLQPV